MSFAHWLAHQRGWSVSMQQRWTPLLGAPSLARTGVREFLAALSFAGHADRASLLCEGWRLVQRGWLQQREWLAVVGEEWTCIDGERGELVQLLRTARWRAAKRGEDFWPALMQHREREALDALPKRFTVYRGCYRGINEHGCSFSLRRSIAEKFAGPDAYLRYRIDGADAIVLAIEVDRDDCALKLDRNELEVIAFVDARRSA
jgi:hypothetical protein